MLVHGPVVSVPQMQHIGVLRAEVLDEGGVNAVQRHRQQVSLRHLLSAHRDHDGLPRHADNQPDIVAVVVEGKSGQPWLAVVHYPEHFLVAEVVEPVGCVHEEDEIRVLFRLEVLGHGCSRYGLLLS